MKRILLIITMLLLVTPTPAFCGGNWGRALGDALPKALDNISKMQQMEIQEDENRRAEERQQKEMRQREQMTDYKCMNDCFDAGYSFFYCKKICSY